MSVPLEQELKLLTAQREHLFKQVTTIYELAKLIEKKYSSVSAKQLRSRLTKLEQIRSDFQSLEERVNVTLLKINPKENVSFQAMAAFEDMYYEIIAISSELPEPSTKNKVETSVQQCSSDAVVQAKLPQISLPTFDGQLELWPSFYDTYLTLIHNNSTIAPVAKFHYLVSCLRGSALSLVRQLPITADNYEIVFKDLVSRYQNKRLLAATYLSQITNYGPLKKPSFSDLQKYTNTLNESVNALRAMNLADLSDFLLFQTAYNILDTESRHRYEMENKLDVPTFESLLTFLQRYVKMLETSQHSTGVGEFGVLRQNPGANTKRAQPRSNAYVSSDSRSDTDKGARAFKCYYCGMEHSIYKCEKFKAIDVGSRIKYLQQHKLCEVCLRPHDGKKCKSKWRCFECKGNHSSLIHVDNGHTENISEHSSTSALVGSTRGSSTVLLGTVVALVRDAFGGLLPVRALVDNGSQDCFMTVRCARKLGLPLQKCNVTVSGLGQNKVAQVKGTTKCAIQSRDKGHVFTIKPIVLEQITAKMPSMKISEEVRDCYKHLVLADENFDKPSEIDLLLGAEVFHLIYDGQVIKPRQGLPAAMHSLFGWVLSGPTSVASLQESSTSLLATTDNIEELVKQFWAVEEPPQTHVAAPEDDEVEAMYSRLTYRTSEGGRYVVPLLMKDPSLELGNSYSSALSRQNNLERRFARQPSLCKEYTNFMKEYEELGHMELVKSNEKLGTYYIPHHCVLRPESASTKLRVVFDASCKTSNGFSLNDLVHTGPKLQADIVDLISGFRIHAVSFTCDISKMYRQILIRPEERRWQHVLWRESVSAPLSEYELKTVTYGVKSSPYLAIRTLHQLATDHGKEFPRAAEALRCHTYMDDITTGAPSLEEAVQLRDELIKLLSCAQLELRKWCSNSVELLQGLPESFCQTPKSFSEDGPKALKILGIQWDPNSDEFNYAVKPVDIVCTKRSILSNIAKIFDPLGWLAPLILRAKLLMQDLWREKLQWDENLPSHLCRDWSNFISDLTYLQEVKIPRRVGRVGSKHLLVGFCDGSTKAYGCCVYLVSKMEGKVKPSLLIAKSKVAPLKPLTVNRLELCGAVLLSKVIKHMHILLKDKISISEVVAFTDSSTVLSWLKTEPHRLKTFVAHRVVQITDNLASSCWKYVPTEDNPADLCSRGLPCRDLLSREQWWFGPEWMVKEESCWPAQLMVEPQQDLPELKTCAHLSQAVETGDAFQDLLQRVSKLTTAQRVIAWVYRFISNSRQLENSRYRSKGLRLQELDDALVKLLKSVQESELSEVFFCLRNKKDLPKFLQKLSPFIDFQGNLRVGGRLKNFDIPENAKHPYLLPKGSKLSALIINHYHQKYLHCGPRTLQSLVQRKFWILGIRNLIRSHLSRCVTCFKVKPVPLQPLMGNLPKLRSHQGHCFFNVGIDFGGPFIVKESRRRGARTHKAYICLLICLSSKAVHIELVSELSTAAFIAALDRFVSRRGLCKSIVTDCGTNFVGARRYLCELSQLILQEKEGVTESLNSRNIEWKLNPPSSPHFGGIFESGIKSTKYHLKRVIGAQVLTFEEMCTVLAKVEAILNSRALCSLSSDPAEVEVLTPGHLLIGRPLVALPEPQVEDLHPRNRWQLIQRMSQCFWRTWHRDYLHTLQQKQKWFKISEGPKVGQIVSLIEPNLAPLEWRLGRIHEIHYGNDNIARVVTLKTCRGFIKRPVVKICPLPIE